MEDQPLTKELARDEYDLWVPVPRAFRWVNEVIPDYDRALQALIRRLVGKQIRSGAESYSHGKKQGGTVELSAEIWSLTRFDNDVWETGDLHNFFDVLRRRGYSSDEESLTFFGVRVERAGLQRLLDANAHDDPAVAANVATLPSTVPTKHPGDVPVSEAEAEETDDDRPTVSVSELSVWYGNFTKVYPSWTETLALKSAIGFFAGHKVPRKMIHDLVDDKRPRGELPKDRTGD